MIHELVDLTHKDNIPDLYKKPGSFAKSYFSSFALIAQPVKLNTTIAGYVLYSRINDHYIIVLSRPTNIIYPFVHASDLKSFYTGFFIPVIDADIGHDVNYAFYCNENDAKILLKGVEYDYTVYKSKYEHYLLRYNVASQALLNAIYYAANKKIPKMLKKLDVVTLSDLIWQNKLNINDEQQQRIAARITHHAKQVDAESFIYISLPHISSINNGILKYALHDLITTHIFAQINYNTKYGLYTKKQIKRRNI